jgi:hypothetical protein
VGRPKYLAKIDGIFKALKVRKVKIRLVGHPDFDYHKKRGIF